MLLLAPPAPAQSSGSRGHVVRSPLSLDPGGPDHFAAEHYIVISGSAELRRKPTRLRVVLAITAAGKNPAECEQEQARRQDALRAALAGAGVGPDAVHMDFISMLPVYEWFIEEKDRRRAAYERAVGFRAQTNAHVEVDGEAGLFRVVRAAFGIGVSDVIAVDYWAEGLDETRQAALEAALREARRKADLLLGAAFEVRPKPINVHESTRVLFPKDLYASFETAYEQGYQPQYFRDENIPAISAHRPKNTYYQGLFSNADVTDGGLPMHPEISVVATVKLYFAAPDRPAPARDK